MPVVRPSETLQEKRGKVGRGRGGELRSGGHTMKPKADRKCPDAVSEDCCIVRGGQRGSRHRLIKKKIVEEVLASNTTKLSVGVN